jgi:Transposase DDE domain group 1
VHPGELYPRVGFIVTNLARPAECIVAFYNHRGTAEQWIKEGKGEITRTRLSCRSFAANAVRLQPRARPSARFSRGSKRSPLPTSIAAAAETCIGPCGPSWFGRHIFTSAP